MPLLSASAGSDFTGTCEIWYYVPDDIDDLGRAVNESLKRKKSEPALLRSFFKHAGLKL